MTRRMTAMLGLLPLPMLAGLGAALPINAAQAGTLNEALARAYESNPTLTAARAQQRAVDENVPIEKAAGRVQASLSSSLTQQLHRPNPAATPLRNFTSNASIEAPVYSGGAVRNAVRAAELRVAAGQQNLRASEASVFANVVAAYMDVITDEAVVGLNRQNVTALDVNLRATNDRFEVGDLTRTDVAQSQSRLALARANLQTAEAQLIDSRERYIAIVGIAPDALEPPPPLPGLPDSPETAVAVALEGNPDILAAQKVREASQRDVKVARAQATPRLSAFAQGGYVDYLGTETELSFLQPEAWSAAAGARLTLPLYQGGRPGALQRQAIARESQAIEDYVAAERAVIASTRASYASWQASLETITSTTKAVEATALSLEGVKAENSVGSRTIIEILNAEQEALNARVQLVTAQRNAYVAAFAILANMGHAQARDLNLGGVALYDPATNYGAIKGRWFDFDFRSAPSQVSHGTAAIPPQRADIISRPLP